MVKITFGIIVLNGQPFIKYNLRGLYPFAHQIIIVEGASPAARPFATEYGHSTDGTFEALREFKKEEDPDNKIIIVTAEDEGYSDGFWPGEKDEQSRAYSKRATGNYLWQVDADEFYKPDDIKKLINLLERDSTITAVSFKTITFWGGLDFHCDGWHLRQGAEIFHRLFKWCNGYQYYTHRPPTVIDEQGNDLRVINWINGYTLEKMGINLYHYSLLFPKQVLEKCTYYQNADWSKRENGEGWVESSFNELKQPFRVHNVYKYPGWLLNYKGTHPPIVLKMMDDINSGIIPTSLRKTQDIINLLNNPFYPVAIQLLKFFEFFFFSIKKVYSRIYSIFSKYVKKIE